MNSIIEIFQSNACATTQQTSSFTVLPSLSPHGTLCTSTRRKRDGTGMHGGAVRTWKIFFLENF